MHTKAQSTLTWGNFSIMKITSCWDNQQIYFITQRFVFSFFFFWLLPCRPLQGQNHQSSTPLHTYSKFEKIKSSASDSRKTQTTTNTAKLMPSLHSPNSKEHFFTNCTNELKWFKWCANIYKISRSIQKMPTWHINFSFYILKCFWSMWS